MDINVLLHLFKTHAMCFHGIETWFAKLYKNDLKDVALAYHNAINKMASRRKFDSTHECLDSLKLPIFKHLLAKRMISFAFSIFKTDSPCMAYHRHYFRYQSTFSCEIKKMFFKEYQIANVFDNPLCAIHARIDYVQRAEPRTGGYDPG